ncbi:MULTISPECIES: response regulator transcription factor [unclassified Paenibacillus]|uniref:response regulator transcription factor n=1 Tax=unclassified Paenibacillus TaxID=185978 RepID=UPI001C0F5062|nr:MULTISPECIES: response regulator transcription factor [unclassified Paenibacillus]MBU5442331.1 response regulator transcription factor [Paenibacillus sp. MSJ-34]CAH0119906.1 Transcriptional regulatory protein WalR [Paenibacillus sp. CECT 9249]
MNRANILLVDDEKAIVHMLKTVLAKEGYANVDAAFTAEEALEASRTKTYDIILLDVMLPGQSGFDICPLLRQATDAPILFLTARTTDFDKLTGFALGGDDYITKPFNPLEVVARIKAQLRRRTNGAKAGQERIPSDYYDFGRFQVDAMAGELRVEGELVACPAQVFQLLLFLCRHPNRVFHKKQLYEQVWGEESYCDDNTVMVHIHRIRERIERNPSEPEYLLTVRGLGYKLVRRGDSV